MEEKKEKNIIKINKTILIIIAIIIPIAFILLGMLIGGEISLLDNNTDKDCVNTKKESKTTTDEITFKDTVSNKTFTIFNKLGPNVITARDEDGERYECYSECNDCSRTTYVCYDQKTLNDNYVLIYKDAGNDSYSKYIYDIKNEKVVYDFKNVEKKQYQNFEFYPISSFTKDGGFYVLEVPSLSEEPNHVFIMNENFDIVLYDYIDYYFINDNSIYYIDSKNVNEKTLVVKDNKNKLIEENESIHPIMFSKEFLLYLDKDKNMNILNVKNNNIINTKNKLNGDLWDFKVYDTIIIDYIDPDAKKDVNCDKKAKEFLIERFESSDLNDSQLLNEIKDTAGYELRYKSDGTFISKELKIFYSFMM